MKIFVTGVTGYIGGAVADALIGAGHAVTGLVRPGKDTRALVERGIRPFEGKLQNPRAVAAEAANADALVHAAFESSPSGPLADEAFVDAALDALAGASKTFLYTSDLWVMGNTARDADEESTITAPPLVAWRVAVELKVRAAASRGIRGVVIRPATVYGRGGGLVTMFTRSARETGTAIIPGTGENHWTFVHIDDLAQLYVLALGAAPGSLFIGASGPALKLREVAGAASKAAGAGGRTQTLVLDEALVVWGPAAQGLVLDLRVSGRKAERELGWKPSAPPLIEELRRSYAAAG